MPNNSNKKSDSFVYDTAAAGYSNQSGDCPARSTMKTPKVKPQVLVTMKNNMVTLPGQIFSSTHIPVYLWFLAKNKHPRKRGARCPTLNWIGKDAVIKHHLEMPFRLLKDVPELGCGDPNKSVDDGNVLASTTLEHLPAHYRLKVVYSANCRFSKARMEREGITFKQTPYAIRTK